MEKSVFTALVPCLGMASAYLLTVECLCLPLPVWARFALVPGLAVAGCIAVLICCRLRLNIAVPWFGIKNPDGRSFRIDKRLVYISRNRLLSLFIAAFIGALCAGFAMQRAGSELDRGGIGLPGFDIVRIEGELAKDAWIGGRGDEVVCLVRLSAVEDREGRRSLATGTVRLNMLNDNISRPAGSLMSAAVSGLAPAEGRTWHWYARGTELSRTKPAGLSAIRAAIVDSMDRALSVCALEIKGFAMALLLGRQDELSTEMESAFYSSGCAHLVALSGMHIALIGMLLRKISTPLLGGLFSRFFAVAGTAFFIWIAGPYPSALRALCMFALLQAARIAGYRLELLASLCLSVPILGFVDPLMPLSLGYLLSFGALAGLLSLESLLRKPLVRILRPVGARELAAGVAANIGTLPLICLRNMAFYPQGLIAGIVLGPPVLLFMGLATVQLMWGLVLPQSAVPGLPALLGFLYDTIAWIGNVFATKTG